MKRLLPEQDEGSDRKKLRTESDASDKKEHETVKRLLLEEDENFDRKKLRIESDTSEKTGHETVNELRRSFERLRIDNEDSETGVPAALRMRASRSRWRDGKRQEEREKDQKRKAAERQAMDEEKKTQARLKDKLRKRVQAAGKN